ncbi:MAG: hypothetical protein QXR60_02595 [Candidatus Nanoarchaeia archaeon]
MNYKEQLKEKLKRYRKEDIVITSHALKQATFRGIEAEEVKENIINPERLSFAGKQKARGYGEEKYDCYFGYSKTQCHRYVIIINKECIICTVIKINRRWQRMVEKYARI